MVFGDPTIAENGNVQGTNNGAVLFGAPMRFNTNVNILGDTFIYESPRAGGSSANTSEGFLTSGSVRLTPNRDVDGNGTIDENDRTAGVNLPVGTPVANGLANGLRPSTDTNFSTQGGYVRDASNGTDPNGYPRSIPRLEPPTIDTYVNGSGVSRYRALTRDSGKWFSSGTNRFNTGQFGWGKGIYVNNAKDLQTESARQTGSLSLPREWTNPATSANATWQGPHYIPPGAYVELLGDRIRIYRDDTSLIQKPTGETITLSGGKYIEIPLSDLERQNYVFPDGTPGTLPDGTPALPPLDHDGDDES